MHNDNRNTGQGAVMLQPHVLYRGLYGRVARKLGVDASYVSRVARGERYSKAIESALREEIESITIELGRAPSVRDSDVAHRKGKRISNYVKKNTNSMIQDFLADSQGDPGLRGVQVPLRKRAVPIVAVIAECMKLMVFTPRQMRTKPTKAAVQHGRLRRESGYRPTDLVEEYNLIRRCMFGLAQKHLSEMDPHMLFHDMCQIDEVLDLQLQNALRVFLSAAV